MNNRKKIDSIKKETDGKSIVNPELWNKYIVGDTKIENEIKDFSKKQSVVKKIKLIYKTFLKKYISNKNR